jgi:hypothetical protein
MYKLTPQAGVVVIRKPFQLSVMLHASLLDTIMS